MSRESDHRATGSGGADLEAYDRTSPSSSSNVLTSPLSAFHYRPRYQRLNDPQEEDTSYGGHHTEISELPENDSVHGLRIRFSEHDDDALKLRRASPNLPETQKNGADGMLSPPSARSGSHHRQGSLGSNPFDDASSYGRSSPSLHRLDGPFPSELEEEMLQLKRAPSTIKSYDTSGLQEGEPRCKTQRHFHHSRGTWLSVTILILSVYSTIFSGIWLAVAIGRPRYGRYVTDNGNLPPATASLLCAAFAKTIELSFVSVFVTFLGQVLSQRAFVKQSRGVTVSEMQMRSWVMQPGTMLTHRETVRYAAFTFLGAVSLVTAVMAMLYTTASDGLVAPKLKFGILENKVLYSKVATRFGYEIYIEDNCNTPIGNATDPDHYGQTCVAIEYSGQSYHNYAQWLTKWTQTQTIGLKNGTTVQQSRPPPLGILFDNTTIQGSWIEVQNMTQNSQYYNRIVNNVTMAMPHSGVLGAARDPRNNILQPQDLDGLGEYFLEASVPSPALNVLCAELTPEELSPMVVTLWPGYNGTAPNNTNWPTGYDIPSYPSWLNATAVDDLFGFGEQYGRRMPVFPILPDAYNTVQNITPVTNVMSTDSMYILGNNSNANYMMCSLRVFQSPYCSTLYHASLSGGAMKSLCSDLSNPLMYNNSYPEATSGVYLPDWINVANQWALTMSLGAGLTDNDASNARLLTQLIPTNMSLDPLLPSIAEALAVEAGSTLLLSSLDAPMLHYWNYSMSEYVLDPPQYQAFNATLRSQDYSSGGTQRWQGLFYIVLLLIFATNVFCLVYFILHKGLVTDFIDPQNLFALAINSPHSYVLEGSCGGGPERDQLKSNWHIRLDTARDHFFIESVDEPQHVQQVRRRKRDVLARLVGRKRSAGYHDIQSGGNNSGRGRANTGAGASTTATSPLDGQLQMETSPVAEMFEKLSRKKSILL